MTIMAVGTYRVKGTVNEQNRSSVYEGMEMLVWSRVEDRYWKGTITEIKEDNGEGNQQDNYGYGYGDSSSDNGSTNYPFYVELENSDDLMLGQHVYLEEDRGQGKRKSGIWLPDYYFTMDEDGSTWVWAASTTNVLEKRMVSLGDYDEDLELFQVLSGLDTDDYITTPYDESLKEGLPVIYYDSSDEDLSSDMFGDGSIDWGDDEYYDLYGDEGSFY